MARSARSANLQLDPRTHSNRSRRSSWYSTAVQETRNGFEWKELCWIIVWRILDWTRREAARTCDFASNDQGSARERPWVHISSTNFHESCTMFCVQVTSSWLQVKGAHDDQAGSVFERLYRTAVIKETNAPELQDPEATFTPRLHSPLSANRSVCTSF